jgi:hypothetical protein
MPTTACPSLTWIAHPAACEAATSMDGPRPKSFAEHTLVGCTLLGCTEEKFTFFLPQQPAPHRCDQTHMRRLSERTRESQAAHPGHREGAIQDAGTGREPRAAQIKIHFASALKAIRIASITGIIHELHAMASFFIISGSHETSDIVTTSLVHGPDLQPTQARLHTNRVQDEISARREKGFDLDRRRASDCDEGEGRRPRGPGRVYCGNTEKLGRRPGHVSHESPHRYELNRPRATIIQGDSKWTQPPLDLPRAPHHLATSRIATP